MNKHVLFFRAPGGFVSQPTSHGDRHSVRSPYREWSSGRFGSVRGGGKRKKQVAQKMTKGTAEKDVYLYPVKLCIRAPAHCISLRIRRNAKSANVVYLTRRGRFFPNSLTGVSPMTHFQCCTCRQKKMRNTRSHEVAALARAGNHQQIVRVHSGAPRDGCMKVCT